MQPVFDHAMISLCLPHTVAGMGFAGACRPLQQTACNNSRCRVNLRKFREPEICAEWNRLLQLSLAKVPGLSSSPSTSMSLAKASTTGSDDATDDKDSVQSAAMDPFQALKYAEMTADRIAQLLAPRRIRPPGEVGKSFGFGGHRAILREMNLLRSAREFIKQVLMRVPEIVQSPHRFLRWQLAVTRLNSKLMKSKYCCSAASWPGCLVSRGKCQMCIVCVA